jgi:hypothetical protein
LGGLVFVGRPLRRFLRFEGRGVQVLDEIRQCQDTVAGKFQTTPVRPQGTFEGTRSARRRALDAEKCSRRWHVTLAAFSFNETAALYVAKKLCYDPLNVGSSVGVSIFIFSQNSVG